MKLPASYVMLSAKTFPLTEMNRQALVEAYIDRVLDNMSTKDLIRIVGDQLEENISSYTDEELISEVEDYYPELLEG
jgi:radical SAM superfamily enzyme